MYHWWKCAREWARAGPLLFIEVQDLHLPLLTWADRTRPDSHSEGPVLQILPRVPLFKGSHWSPMANSSRTQSTALDQTQVTGSGHYVHHRSGEKQRVSRCSKIDRTQSGFIGQTLSRVQFSPEPLFSCHIVRIGITKVRYGHLKSPGSDRVQNHTETSQTPRTRSDRTWPDSASGSGPLHVISAALQQNWTPASGYGLSSTQGPVLTWPSCPSRNTDQAQPVRVWCWQSQGPVLDLRLLFFFYLKHFTLASKLLTIMCITQVHVC
jgi:hypothetical protein